MCFGSYKYKMVMKFILVNLLLVQISNVATWPSHSDSHHRYHHHYDDDVFYDLHFHREHDFGENDPDFSGLPDLEFAPSGRIVNHLPPPGIFGKSSKERNSDTRHGGIVTSSSSNPATCRCIDVKKCPAVMEQIQWRPIDDDLRKRLRSAACGFRGFEPQVCCPPSVDEGRARRTPPHNSWSSWEDDNDKSNDFGHNHFGNHFQFPPTSKPHSDSNSRKPSRPKTRPVMWPGEQQDNEGSSRESSSRPPKTTTSSPRFSDEDSSGRRDERIVNRGSLINPRTCGVAINNRIIGGDDAGPGQFPWVARIGYKSPGSRRLLYRCGGAMINKDYVITAAHCVTNLPHTLQLAGVRLGEVEDNNTSEPNECFGSDCADFPQDFRIGKVTIHSQYDVPRFANDIALIRLSRSANLTGYVSPICLPVGQYSFPRDKNLTGNTAIVAGWGSMTPDSATSSTSLQWVKLSVGDLSDCISTYRNRFNITVTQTHMCTRPKANVDACQGDSGGPLVMESPNERYLLAGIVSFGPRRCGTADLPGVYTRITSFVDWIVDNVRP